MGKAHRHLTECPNCGTRLGKGVNYCPECGQPNHDLKVPFRHLFHELLESLFHLDGKSYQTARSLVFKPGQLSNEFRAGRRASYVPPIRLYVFVSFLFFLVLSLTASRHDSNEELEPGNELKFSFSSISSDQLKGLNDAQIDSLMTAEGMTPTALSHYIARQLARVSEGGREALNHMLVKGATYMMFVLMPFFGLLIYLFHRKQSDYYLDCLVFSIHYHAFVFLLLTIVVLVDRLTNSSYLLLAAPLLLFAYFWMALRRVYSQSRMKTTLKAFALGFLHFLSVLFGFLIVAAGSILLF